MKQNRPNKWSDEKEARVRRDLQIYEEFKGYISDPQQSRVEAAKFIQNKYGFRSLSSVYVIIKRVEKLGVL